MPYATNPDDGVRIYYEDTGKGPPLVLVHGFSQSGNTWHRYGYVDVPKEDYGLLLLDLRAHGQSEGPHDAESYAMARMIGDIVAVLDHAGMERALYFGYSGVAGWGSDSGSLRPSGSRRWPSGDDPDRGKGPVRLQAGQGDSDGHPECNTSDAARSQPPGSVYAL